MPQKTGASVEVLLEKITGYLGGRISRAEAASQLQISKKAFARWVGRYKANGMPGLEARKEWTRYSAEEKTQAVIEYLKGNGSTSAHAHPALHSMWLKICLNAISTPKSPTRNG